MHYEQLLGILNKFYCTLDVLRVLISFIHYQHIGFSKITVYLILFSNSPTSISHNSSKEEQTSK